jgi:hypothetical protein
MGALTLVQNEESTELAASHWANARNLPHARRQC